MVLDMGGILSPLLFNVNVDLMNIELNKTPIGRTIGNLIVNYSCYADDLILFSPSHKGLQILLNVCNGIGWSLDININESKRYTGTSVCITGYTPILQAKHLGSGHTPVRLFTEFENIKLSFSDFQKLDTSQKHVSDYKTVGWPFSLNTKIFINLSRWGFSVKQSEYQWCLEISERHWITSE